jgi:hypothetical protein
LSSTPQRITVPSSGGSSCHGALADMAAAKISPLIEEVQEVGSWRTRMELLLMLLLCRCVS